MRTVSCEEVRSSSVSQKSRSGTSAPATSASASASATSASSTNSKISKVTNSKATGNKVTESHFTPRTRRLAILSKTHARTTTIYGEGGPFPTNFSRVARMDFAWATTKDVSKLNTDPILKDALTRAAKDDDVKKKLITFVRDLSSLYNSC